MPGLKTETKLVKRLACLLLSAASIGACSPQAPEPTPSPVQSTEAAPAAPDYAAIAADPSRPAADRDADNLRKPVQMLEFAQLEEGQAVLEMLPGAGYFTHLFAGTVGESGSVVLYVPDELVSKKWVPLQRAEELRDAMADPAVSVAHFPLSGPVPEAMAEKFDLVWTSRNYHDFHNIEEFDPAAYNAMVMDLLKPGGFYVVLDHSAPEGTAAQHSDTTHRIDGDFVRREIEASGFLYDGASAVLSNPEDPRDIDVRDPSVIGRTDQFILRFRKSG